MTSPSVRRWGKNPITCLLPTCLQASGGAPARLDVDVTREDQERINTFSRLNAKSHELEAQITAKKVSRVKDRRRRPAASRRAITF